MLEVGTSQLYVATSAESFIVKVTQTRICDKGGNSTTYLVIYLLSK